MLPRGWCTCATTAEPAPRAGGESPASGPPGAGMLAGLRRPALRLPPDPLQGLGFFLPEAARTPPPACFKKTTRSLRRAEATDPWGGGCGQKGARQLEEAGVPRVAGRGRGPCSSSLALVRPPQRGPQPSTTLPPRTRGESGQSRLSALDVVLAPRPPEPPPTPAACLDPVLPGALDCRDRTWPRASKRRTPRDG